MTCQKLAAATLVASVCVRARRAGVRFVCTDTELADRERHFSENTARIVVAGFNAFLVGNRIFCGIDSELRSANKTNDGENTERNGQYTVILAFGGESAEAGANRFGNVSAAAAANARTAYLVGYLYAENNWIDHLNDGNGYVSVTHTGNEE